MKNKPTDMQTMVDTMTPCEIQDVVTESMGTLISSVGAMLSKQRIERGLKGDPTPFEVIGWISANITNPVFSCYKQTEVKPQDNA